MTNPVPAQRPVERDEGLHAQRASVVQPFGPDLGRGLRQPVDGHVPLVDPEEARDGHLPCRVHRVGGADPGLSPGHVVPQADPGAVLPDDQVHGGPPVEGGTVLGVEAPAAPETGIARERRGRKEAEAQEKSQV